MGSREAVVTALREALERRPQLAKIRAAHSARRERGEFGR
jgi:hypothetical protein